MFIIYITLILLAAALIFVIYDDYTKRMEHQKFLDRLTPEGRANYDKKMEQNRIKQEQDLFILAHGPINPDLVCPHCQTKGSVHSTSYSVNRVADGKIGGIVKTNVKINQVESGTARHCAKCKSNWKI